MNLECSVTPVVSHVGFGQRLRAFVQVLPFFSAVQKLHLDGRCDDAVSF